MSLNSHDPYNLQRFVDAQNAVFEQVCKELQEGRKRSHWMWFIFPQLKGLGYSETAMKFAISSQREAEEYLKHPVLGIRLNHCTRLVNLVEGRSIYEILGYPDDLKFKSSMTLFFKSTSKTRFLRMPCKSILAANLILELLIYYDGRRVTSLPTFASAPKVSATSWAARRGMR